MDQTWKAAVLTVSDGVFHGTRTDASGAALAELLSGAGFEIADTAVVADEVPDIEAAIRRMAGVANLVVSTGGTGFGPRDVTPEATRRVVERMAPGLAETMRAVGRQASPMAIISRGVTGVVGSTLILNLPGSPRGAVESLQTVMDVVPHALQLLSGDTQHSSAQTSLPASEASGPTATASVGAEHRHEHGHGAGAGGGEGRGDGRGQGHDHGHGAGGHDHGAGQGQGTGAGAGAGAQHSHDHATSGSEPAQAAAAAGPAVTSTAAGPTGVGPSEVTLDLARKLAGGHEVLLATAIRTDGAPPCQPGQKLLLGAEGPLSGTLGCSEFDDSAVADAAQVLATGKPLLTTYHHDLGTVEVYLEPYLRRPQLAVLAATPIALWLLRWGRDLGYETILIESRPGWITPEHREAAGRVIADPAELTSSSAGDGGQGREMDVVATDHEAPDVPEKVAALVPANPRFIGIIGSARHTSGHLEVLRSMGVPAEQVDRIQSPVGLNIGAKTPPEIALSILSGLLAARTGRPGGWIDTRERS